MHVILFTCNNACTQCTHTYVHAHTLHDTLYVPLCRQGAAQQLHHDFTEMKTWLTEAVDAFDERVKAQVSHSPALSCLAQGLSAMLGREEPPSALPPPAAGDVSSLTSGDKISPFFQHILSLPVVSDTSCMFDCTNLSEWKQCMK